MNEDYTMKIIDGSYAVSVRLILVLFVLISLAIPDSSARAEARLHVSNVEFHPYLLWKDTYSSNIFSTPVNEKHDWITTVIPGLKIDVPMEKKHLFEAEYNAIMNRHNFYVTENTTAMNARAFVQSEVTSKFNFKVAENWAQANEPRGQSATGFIEKYWSSKTSGTATYQVVDISKLQFDFSKDKYVYRQSKFRNRNEDFGAGYIYFKVLPKTHVFAEYEHRRIDYEKTENKLDNDVDSGFAGVTWELSEQSKGTVKGGYTSKRFDANELRASNVNSWAAFVDASHNFTRSTSLKVTGQRTVNEANLQGSYYFVSTGVYGELTQRFFRKASVVLSGSYATDKFSNAVASISPLRRIDNTAGGGLALKYAFAEWLEGALSYNHRTRDSNINANDYDVNEYAISLNLSL